jgi:excisionase family DNA binding protein
VISGRSVTTRPVPSCGLVAVDATALVQLVTIASELRDRRLAAAVGALVAGGVAPARPPARRWLTVSEAAEALRLSERTVRRRCQDGTIPTTRVGRVWRIDPAVTGTYGQPGP